MRRVLLASIGLWLAAATAPAQTIVFVAGPPSHGYGAHEHRAGLLLISRLLKEAYPQAETVVFEHGWPADDSALDGAAALVIDCDGGKHVAQGRFDEITRRAQQGLGVALIHYSLDRPAAEGGNAIREWIGGNYEQGVSVNPRWTLEVRELPDHPIARGLRPFRLYDEWYFNMRFQPGMKGVTPILSGRPTQPVLLRPDGRHGGSPALRQSVGRGEMHHVAWAYERPGGGRGFGFSGAHDHANYQDDNFRTAVLNGVAWTAGLEIPADGTPSRRPTLAEIEANQDEPKPADWDLSEGLILPGSAEPIFETRAQRGRTAIDLPWSERQDRRIYLVTLGEGEAVWANPRFLGESNAQAQLADDHWVRAISAGGPLNPDQVKRHGTRSLHTPANSLLDFHVPTGATRFQTEVSGPGIRFLIFTEPPAQRYLPWLQ